MGEEEGKGTGEGGIFEREKLLGASEKSKPNKLSFFQ